MWTESLPMRNSGVLTSTQDMSLSNWTPAQTVAANQPGTRHYASNPNLPFLTLPCQSNIWPTATSYRRFTFVFRPVKNIDLASHSLGRDQIRLLRHISRSVDFAIVIDGLLDCDSRSRFLM